MRTAKAILASLPCSLALAAGGLLAQQPQAPIAPPQAAATESSPASKAAIPTLPTELKGETTGIDPRTLNSYSNTRELQITSQEGGKITGTYTRWMRVPSAPAILCIKADKLPMTGTYDGEKIVLAVKGSLNNPVCTDYSVSFVRGKEHYFERKSPDGKTVWYLDPTK